jgi:hypothetical protein
MAPGFSAAMKDLSFGGDFDSITQFVTPLPLLPLPTSVDSKESGDVVCVG